jgi:hypothetical protein
MGYVKKTKPLSTIFTRARTEKTQIFSVRRARVAKTEKTRYFF